ncbi:MAG: hypothetical protein Q4A08_09530 [Bacteroidales bacterium]|nr:hypothetical protein [Bacteroidales bacterium]
MRKLFISALSMLAVAMGFTACSSDDDFVSNPDQSGRIRAYATTEQESATRTTLNGDDTNGYQVFWSENDEITIGGKVFKLIEGVGTSTGGFELKTGEEDPTAGDDVIAYYPSEYNGANWPTTQTYVANNIPQGVPMKATGISVYYGEGPMVSPISFKNEGGILRLNLKGTAKVASIKISATELTNPITLNCGSTGVQLDASTATPFHIAVPGADDPGTAYSGLKIEITDDAGAVCTKTLKNDKTITVQRSMITDITLTAKFPPAGSIGEATRTGDISVKWIQLWEGGPKFAEYNVGATSVAEYGDYLTWAENIASTQWGSNWRMPTKEEFSDAEGGLLYECDCVWTVNYNETGINGLLCTGKGVYSTNSIFLPAAGSPDEDDYEGCGVYWSSTPDGEFCARYLAFYPGGKGMYSYTRTLRFSVRAVLDETPKTTGTAEVNESAGITGNKVNWVQLWEGGPKFAEFNVGANSVAEYGAYYTWGGTYANGEGIDWLDDHNTDTEILAGTYDTATALWGDKWRMPTKEELSDAKGGLLYECDCVWTVNYNETGINGLLCTGKGDYSSNSVFLPAAGLCDKNIGGVFAKGEAVSYWSSTPIVDGPGLSAYYLLFYPNIAQGVEWTDKGIGYSVRAVLK